MKNSEWGAVAYLTHSQYGKNGNEISINTSSDFITATGSTDASTTGNITGIYDLSGGAWEQVATYNSAFPSIGAAYLKTSAIYGSAIGTNIGAIGLEKGSTKYLTEYRNSTDQNYIGQTDAGNGYTSFAEFKEAGEKISITGDAMAEVYNKRNSVNCQAKINKNSHIKLSKFVLNKKIGHFCLDTKLVFGKVFCIWQETFSFCLNSNVFPFLCRILSKTFSCKCIKNMVYIM